MRTSSGPRLGKEPFERLREQIATAAALCAEDQLLDLADGLHEAIRRRREQRHCERKPPADGREALCLEAGWPTWLTAAPLEQRTFRT